ncbi:hypothetical protein CHGG_00195 [Chaetomium globosum CBS 148.51]|uniref:Uncharacterized protein n=1 Tax=Chaetomium globosum (strain ATCC 6205 / CBS 148.51 / DSM 1962 / NBRC 6347 / NRRL 1970) TaxID=306901 RepID=Q2HHV9_CHAGB|nr:uncharacterized protein CHGG_00195 [Chaetomium globosum CBS 148.51]EAQ91960.1 hypothetical protein CHGG_00195 [Chaetomium globosum CBS 148.51]
MATLAVDPEEESTESCIVVANRTSPRSRTSTVPKKSAIPMRPATRGGRSRGQAQPIKRPRGRPRKPRNNTAETAIVLSDSDSEDDSNEPPRNDKKRPITKLEAPTTAPDPKRLAPFHHASSSSQAVFAPIRAGTDEVRQQLASEKKLRAEAEEKLTELQRLLDEKEASWAADLAAQAMPLQLQLQKMTKDKTDVDAVAQDLKARLEASLSKNQEYESSLESLTANAAKAEEIKAKAEQQDTLIANQDAEITQLKKAVVSRAKELAEAGQRFGAMTATLRDLTTRHTAATEMIQQHESRIQHLTHALSEAKNNPVTVDGPRAAHRKDGRGGANGLGPRVAACVWKISWRRRKKKLNVAEKELAAMEARRKDTDDKVVQQIAMTVNKRKQAEGKLKAKEQQLAHSEEILAEQKSNLLRLKKQLAEAEHAIPPHAQESINNLTCERDALLGETQGRLKEIEALQNSVGSLRSAIASLEQEKQQLTAAVADKELVTKELAAHKDLVTVLGRERQQFEASSARAWEEVVPLKAQLTEHKRALLDLRNQSLRWNSASENAMQQIGTLQKERDHLRDAVTRLQGETESLRAEYTQVVNKATTREAQLHDRISQMTHNLEARHGEVVQLRQNLVRQCLREDILQKDMAAKSTRLLQLEGELKEKQAVVATKQEEIDGLREGINNLRTAVTKLETDFAAQREELEQRNAMLIDKEQAIAAKRSQIQQLQETGLELTAQKTQLQDDLTDQKGKLQQLATQLTQLISDNEELRTASTAKEQTIDSLRQQLFNVSREKTNLQHQTTARLSEIDTLTTQLATAATTIQTLTQTTTTLKQTTSALQSDLHTLTTQQSSTAALASTLESETTALKSQLADTTAQAAQDIAALEARIAQLGVEKAALEGARREQDALVEKLRGEVAEVLAEGEALDEYLAKRDGCIERVRGFVKTLPQWMEICLRDFRNTASNVSPNRV